MANTSELTILAICSNAIRSLKGFNSLLFHHFLAWSILTGFIKSLLKPFLSNEPGIEFKSILPSDLNIWLTAESVLSGAGASGSVKICTISSFLLSGEGLWSFAYAILS